MKYIFTITFAFLFSTVMAYSQMFTPITSEEAYSAAKDYAVQNIGDQAQLVFIGHYLETLKVTFNGNEFEIPSGFSIETGKANTWFFRFKSGENVSEVGIINSVMLGGFYPLGINISEYLDLSKMINTQAVIAENDIVNSADMGQYFTPNTDFMAKYNTLESYDGGILGLFVNGPVPELDQALYWGYWFMRDNGDHEMCALKIADKELECLNLTAVIEVNTPSVSISPNPTSDVINIRNTEFATEYTISNYYGEMILQGELIEGQNTLDISELESGMYFVQLSNNSGMIKAEKIIVK